MPLRKGSSPRTISRNISELVGAYNKKGRIGTSRPKNKPQAVKQAAAIAYTKAGKSTNMKRGGVMGPAKVVKKKDGNRSVKIY